MMCLKLKKEKSCDLADSFPGEMDHEPRQGAYLATVPVGVQPENMSQHVEETEEIAQLDPCPSQAEAANQHQTEA